MPWSEAVQPVRMERVAVVAPADRLRDALVHVADAGTVQLDQTSADDRADGPARRLQRLDATAATPALAPRTPDLDALERAGRADLLAGEAQLAAYAAGAVARGEVAALAGWCPAPELPALTRRLAPAGCAVAPIPVPPGAQPPTLLAGGTELRRSFTPLVRTYGTVPYADVDPTPVAGAAYVVMFGMMFGDAGHGALLVLLAVLARLGRPRVLARLRPVWPFIATAGLAATAFGALYGELFGPTGALPVLWLAPLEEPVRLLVVAVALGAVLLAVAYALGIVNRWRESGPRLALYAPSGIAGAAVFLGLGGVFGGLFVHSGLLTLAGAAVAGAGFVLAAAGLYAGSGGGATGVVQTCVGLFDVLVRLGSNLVSFARLAAFGMTHAALGWVVWQGTVALAGKGWAGVLGAGAVFLAGNALTFTLEALVAGVQALRLEFYELFSRVFEVEGTPFRPWHVPMSAEKEP
ncbi:V/A-type H+-transporting ATPase subunit I [Amycolatopsis lexingtonensis]|uniref:V/A-type H+-transporting ATPase subunit I n=1 Tax=Amycolatopsis lexingtonensis TaxID=218822 RepID=A0ABR9HSW8_9PSEU|nr:V-type ATPase 116kDa subunit family protein [Amycolatopsis lexingtonensis]MBE1494021.1 V/A-type H+-transporting ATPase subunit I [Amycolatopsis lexingtonensis]